MKKTTNNFKFLLLFSIFLKFSACNFAPGSYPYAQKYEINHPEDEVKKAINKFKEDFPEYNVPKVTINNQGSWELLDEQTRDPSYWYKFYFYYEKEDKILFTWTRQSTTKSTTFALVGINKGKNIGNWRDINQDFDNSENEKEIELFEKRILNQILKNLKNK
jgi:hypothetical protein